MVADITRVDFPVGGTEISIIIDNQRNRAINGSRGICAGAQLCAKNCNIILALIRVRIIAFTPLGHIFVVANAHDWCPARRIAVSSQATKIAGRGGTIVCQTKVVSHLVRAGLGHVGGHAAAQLVVVHQRWLIIGIVASAPHTNISHTPSALTRHGIAVFIAILGKQ